MYITDIRRLNVWANTFSWQIMSQLVDKAVTGQLEVFQPLFVGRQIVL